MRLTPGQVGLEQWRTVWAGASPSLDAGASARAAASAEAVQRIVARGEPVYGINTGFGRLASVRIETADLERLQVPTLVVLGGRDDIVPVEASVRRFEATAAGVRRSQHVRVFADGGHRLQTDTGFADGYLAAISRWCRGDPLVA